MLIAGGAGLCGAQCLPTVTTRRDGGAERVDALVDPSSSVQPYGMNTERRAVEGTVDGTDATAVDATAGNATAVDHAPPLAMISHLARGGGSSPPLIPYELVPPWSTTMLKAAPSAVFEVDSHSS